MSTQKIAVALAVVAVVTVAAVSVWADLTSQDVKTIVSSLRPYQVLSGQVATEFEVIYVLDNETKRLAVLKYDMSKGVLVPIAGRFLVKDFNSGPDGGGYSMVTTQLTNQRGLLYVTDYASRRALVYQVNIAANTVVPQQPIELRNLFRD